MKNLAVAYGLMRQQRGIPSTQEKSETLPQFSFRSPKAIAERIGQKRLEKAAYEKADSPTMDSDDLDNDAATLDNPLFGDFSLSEEMPNGEIGEPIQPDPTSEDPRAKRRLAISDIMRQIRFKGI